MTKPPRDPWPDATLPLLSDPYRYLSRRARALGSDAFRLRVLGRPAYALTGPEGAAAFYGPAMRRRGATPGRVRRVLFGPKGVVQGLDGAAHRHRKAMHLSLMGEASLDALERRFVEAVEARLPGWREAGEVDLYEALRPAVAEAVCAWAGVPLEGRDAEARGRQLAAMFEHAASVGLPHRRGKRARAGAQAWIEGVLGAIREGRLAAPKGSAAAVLARHEGLGGERPPLDVMAADLLSVLRPTVAVSIYMVHLSHALHRHPGHAGAVAADPAHRRAFVEEVRRLYPFFPLLAAVTNEELRFGAMRLKRGRKVLLDLYGTSRDPRSWDEPDAFRPERFLGWSGDPFATIPQGGGEHATGHRCPGEWITIRLMERWAEMATARLAWEVRTPEAEPRMERIPALYEGGFRVGALRERAAAA